MQIENPYRICYRKSINEPFQYLYFKKDGEARREWRNMRYGGYIGCVQHWNYQERIWIG